MSIQSLLIYVLVIIIVVSAIIVGQTLFREKNAQAVRDVLKIEVKTLAREPIRYYHRPTTLGGGGRSFVNYMGVKETVSKTKVDGKLPKGKQIHSNDNGVFIVSAAAKDSVVIEAVGTVTGNNRSSPVQIQGVMKIRGVRIRELN